MVKQINIFLDDDEHEEIKKSKGELTWVEFLKKAARELKRNKTK